MNRNLVGSIYGRSSIKIAHFVTIRSQAWPPQAILVSDWLISKKSYPLKPSSQNEQQFGRKHIWKVLYKVSSKQNERWATQAQPTEPLLVFIFLLWSFIIMFKLRVQYTWCSRFDQNILFSHLIPFYFKWFIYLFAFRNFSVVFSLPESLDS